LVNKRLRCAR